jgi:hypothetical protein
MLVKRMQDFLFDPEWGFGPGPSDSTLVSHFEGDNGSFIVALSVREDAQQLVFYAYAPDVTPDEHLGAMMELVTRANYGLIIGNFELDLVDGEVRFKVALDVEGLEDPTVVVKSHLAAALTTLDQYFPAIVAVQSGEKTAADALAQVE